MAITPSYSGRRPEAKSGEFLPWTPRWGCIHTYHSAVNSSRLLSPQQVSYWDFESCIARRERGWRSEEALRGPLVTGNKEGPRSLGGLREMRR